MHYSVLCSKEDLAIVNNFVDSVKTRAVFVNLTSSLCTEDHVQDIIIDSQRSK